MSKITIYPLDHQERTDAYNKMVEELKLKREQFYRDNPNFPIKTMYLNVISPPQKFVLIEEDN